MFGSLQFGGSQRAYNTRQLFVADSSHQLSVQSRLLWIRIVSSSPSVFAIRAASRAACCSNFATDIVFFAATLVLAFVMFEFKCLPFLVIRRYATAANASCDASQKICISVPTSASAIGLMHLGIFSSLISSSFLSHLSHSRLPFIPFLVF